MQPRDYRGSGNGVGLDWNILEGVGSNWNALEGVRLYWNGVESHWKILECILGH